MGTALVYVGMALLVVAFMGGAWLMARRLPDPQSRGRSREPGPRRS